MLRLQLGRNWDFVFVKGRGVKSDVCHLTASLSHSWSWLFLVGLRREKRESQKEGQVSLNSLKQIKNK